MRTSSSAEPNPLLGVLRIGTTQACWSAMPRCDSWPSLRRAAVAQLEAALSLLVHGRQAEPSPVVAHVHRGSEGRSLWSASHGSASPLSALAAPGSLLPSPETSTRAQWGRVAASGGGGGATQVVRRPVNGGHWVPDRVPAVISGAGALVGDWRGERRKAPARGGLLEMARPGLEPGTPRFSVVKTL